MSGGPARAANRRIEIKIPEVPDDVRLQTRRALHLLIWAAGVMVALYVFLAPYVLEHYLRPKAYRTSSGTSNETTRLLVIEDATLGVLCLREPADAPADPDAIQSPAPLPRELEPGSSLLYWTVKGLEEAYGPPGAAYAAGDASTPVYQRVLLGVTNGTEPRQVLWAANDKWALVTSAFYRLLTFGILLPRQLDILLTYDGAGSCDSESTGSAVVARVPLPGSSRLNCPDLDGVVVVRDANAPLDARKYYLDNCTAAADGEGGGSTSSAGAPSLAPWRSARMVAVAAGYSAGLCGLVALLGTALCVKLVADGLRAKHTSLMAALEMLHDVGRVQLPDGNFLVKVRAAGGGSSRAFLSPHGTGSGGGATGNEASTSAGDRKAATTFGDLGASAGGGVVTTGVSPFTADDDVAPAGRAAEEVGPVAEANEAKDGGPSGSRQAAAGLLKTFSVAASKPFSRVRIMIERLGDVMNGARPQASQPQQQAGNIQVQVQVTAQQTEPPVQKTADEMWAEYEERVKREYRLLDLQSFSADESLDGVRWEYHLRTRLGSYFPLQFASSPSFETANILRALLGLKYHVLLCPKNPSGVTGVVQADYATTALDEAIHQRVEAAANRTAGVGQAGPVLTDYEAYVADLETRMLIDNLWRARRQYWIANTPESRWLRLYETAKLDPRVTSERIAHPEGDPEWLMDQADRGASPVSTQPYDRRSQVAPGMPPRLRRVLGDTGFGSGGRAGSRGGATGPADSRRAVPPEMASAADEVLGVAGVMELLAGAVAQAVVLTGHHVRSVAGDLSGMRGASGGGGGGVLDGGAVAKRLVEAVVRSVTLLAAEVRDVGSPLWSRMHDPAANAVGATAAPPQQSPAAVAGAAKTCACHIARQFLTDLWDVPAEVLPPSRKRCIVARLAAKARNCQKAVVENAGAGGGKPQGGAAPGSSATEEPQRPVHPAAGRAWDVWGAALEVLVVAVEALGTEDDHLAGALGDDAENATDAGGVAEPQRAMLANTLDRLGRRLLAIGSGMRRVKTFLSQLLGLRALGIMLFGSVIPFFTCLVAASTALLWDPTGPWTGLRGWGWLMLPSVVFVLLLAVEVSNAMGLSLLEAAFLSRREPALVRVAGAPPRGSWLPQPDMEEGLHTAAFHSSPPSPWRSRFTRLRQVLRWFCGLLLVLHLVAGLWYCLMVMSWMSLSAILGAPGAASVILTIASGAALVGFHIQQLREKSIEVRAYMAHLFNECRATMRHASSQTRLLPVKTAQKRRGEDTAGGGGGGEEGSVDEGSVDEDENPSSYAATLHAQVQAMFLALERETDYQEEIMFQQSITPGWMIASVTAVIITYGALLIFLWLGTYAFDYTESWGFAVIAPLTALLSLLKGRSEVGNATERVKDGLPENVANAADTVKSMASGSEAIDVLTFAPQGREPKPEDEVVQTMKDHLNRVQAHMSSIINHLADMQRERRANEHGAVRKAVASGELKDKQLAALIAQLVSLVQLAPAKAAPKDGSDKTIELLVAVGSLQEDTRKQRQMLADMCRVLGVEEWAQAQEKPTVVKRLDEVGRGTDKILKKLDGIGEQASNILFPLPNAVGPQLPPILPRLNPDADERLVSLVKDLASKLGDAESKITNVMKQIEEQVVGQLQVMCNEDSRKAVDDADTIQWKELLSKFISEAKDLREDLVGGIKSNLAPIANSLGGIECKLDPLSSRLSSIESTLAPVSGGLAGLGSQIDPLSSRLSSIESILAPISGSLTGLGLKLDPISCCLGGIESKLDPLSSRLSSIESTLAPISGSLTGLGVKLDPISCCLGGIESKLDPLSSRLSGIESTLAPISIGLVGLGSKLDQMSCCLVSIESNLEDSRKAVDSGFAHLLLMDPLLPGMQQLQSSMDTVAEELRACRAAAEVVASVDANVAMLKSQVEDTDRWLRSEESLEGYAATLHFDGEAGDAEERSLEHSGNQAWRESGNTGQLGPAAAAAGVSAVIGVSSERPRVHGTSFHGLLWRLALQFASDVRAVVKEPFAHVSELIGGLHTGMEASLEVLKHLNLRLSSLEAQLVPRLAAHEQSLGGIEAKLEGLERGVEFKLADLAVGVNVKLTALLGRIEARLEDLQGGEVAVAHLHAARMADETAPVAVGTPGAPGGDGSRVVAAWEQAGDGHLHRKVSMDDLYGLLLEVGSSLHSALPVLCEQLSFTLLGHRGTQIFGAPQDDSVTLMMVVEALLDAKLPGQGQDPQPSPPPHPPLPAPQPLRVPPNLSLVPYLREQLFGGDEPVLQRFSEENWTELSNWIHKYGEEEGVSLDRMGADWGYPRFKAGSKLNLGLWMAAVKKKTRSIAKRILEESGGGGGGTAPDTQLLPRTASGTKGGSRRVSTVLRAVETVLSDSGPKGHEALSRLRGSSGNIGVHGNSERGTASGALAGDGDAEGKDYEGWGQPPPKGILTALAKPSRPHSGRMETR